MKKILLAFTVALTCLSAAAFAQIPVKTLVEISKAEDELRYDKTLEDLMKSANAKIRARAALAAGRIGNDTALPALIARLENDTDSIVQLTVAFAVGEIESIKGADAILKVLKEPRVLDLVRARAVEAAGKIAAANAGDPKSKTLGAAILETLESGAKGNLPPHSPTVLLALTAALRARPAGADAVVAKFLTHSDPRIRADAGNTLARLRAKNANEPLRKMLVSDTDAVARANAARALGAAEDKEAFAILLNAATGDKDLRVRVSAIRALGTLRDAKAADKLIERGEKLLVDHWKSKLANPSEKNELLEIATVLGRILINTKNEKAVIFLESLRQADKAASPEIEIALARISPNDYAESLHGVIENYFESNWRQSSAAFQGLGEIANLEGNSDAKLKARLLLLQIIQLWIQTKDPKAEFAPNTEFAVPDLLRAFAGYKSETMSEILRPLLASEKDLFIRAAIAEILADQPASKENVEALKTAFVGSLVFDKDYNDAQLAILDALFKLDKKESVGTFLIALGAPDYLVRKKAFQLLRTPGMEKDSPGIPTMLENAVAKKKDQLLPYNPAFGTKLGGILNTNADYTRAARRKNGSVKAVLTTEKGVFTIELLPEDAPLTVDNFIKLARSGYFNGLAVHRVVPNFVMQDGDPRGDGNGGPGAQIRCEMNMLGYERGAVGMALSGKDTGGSQWFVTHSAQPHLDGGYTIFGRVNETGMKIVDSIVRGDKILSVKIVEGKGRNPRVIKGAE